MRIALPLLLAALLFVPGQAHADSLWFQFLNSDVEFGIWGAHHDGRDGEVRPSGGALVFGAFFDTDLAGPADQTLLRDATGKVVQSNYFYPASSFRFEFFRFAFGEFTLPLTSYGLYVPESSAGLVEPGPYVNGDYGGDVYFTLGPGVMDASLARRLGIGRHIVGGIGGSDMAYGFSAAGGCDGGALGTYVSEERHACDGATWISLEVPEPASLALMAFGVVVLVGRYRSAVGRR